jgi:hypothetical protein
VERIIGSPSFYEFALWSPHFLLFAFSITLIGKEIKPFVYPHFCPFFQTLPHLNIILTLFTSFYSFYTNCHPHFFKSSFQLAHYIYAPFSFLFCPVWCQPIEDGQRIIFLEYDKIRLSYSTIPLSKPHIFSLSVVSVIIITFVLDSLISYYT